MPTPKKKSNMVVRRTGMQMYNNDELVKIYQGLRSIEKESPEWFLKCFFFRCMLGICALRINELRQIRFEDAMIGPDPPIVFIAHPKGGEKNQRWAQVTPEFADRFRAFIRERKTTPGGFFFPSPNRPREPYNVWTCHQWWDQVVKRLGIVNLGSHDGGRNTAISWEIHRRKWSPNYYMDIVQIHMASGHNYQTMMEHYVQDIPDRRYATTQPSWVKEARIENTDSES